MFRSARAAALALPFLLCLLPASILAQQKDDAFYESVDVSVVNIEVFVTDGEGKRVTGLTRDDFEVYKDGKKVDVTYFYASEGKKTRLLVAEGPESETEQLQLAVYIDTEQLPRKARPRIMKAVEDFLVARALPGEQALIASYSGADTLKVRQVPMDRPALAAVLQEIAEIRKPTRPARRTREGSRARRSPIPGDEALTSRPGWPRWRLRRPSGPPRPTS